MFPYTNNKVSCQNFVEVDHEIFSMAVLSLPLIQEGQLSVSGKRMCTILVNRLEDKDCPVNVWLGKLTVLDRTPLGCMGRETSTQTNKQIHVRMYRQTLWSRSSAHNCIQHFIVESFHYPIIQIKHFLFPKVPP